MGKSWLTWSRATLLLTLSMKTSNSSRHLENICESRVYFREKASNVAEVVAQLVEWSLPRPKVCGLNLIISCYKNLKMKKKRSGTASHQANKKLLRKYNSIHFYQPTVSNPWILYFKNSNICLNFRFWMLAATFSYKVRHNMDAT